MRFVYPPQALACKRADIYYPTPSARKETCQKGKFFVFCKENKGFEPNAVRISPASFSLQTGGYLPSHPFRQKLDFLCKCRLKGLFFCFVKQTQCFITGSETIA